MDRQKLKEKAENDARVFLRNLDIVSTARWNSVHNFKDYLRQIEDDFDCSDPKDKSKLARIYADAYMDKFFELLKKKEPEEKEPENESD